MGSHVLVASRGACSQLPHNSFGFLPNHISGFLISCFSSTSIPSSRGFNKLQINTLWSALPFSPEPSTPLPSASHVPSLADETLVGTGSQTPNLSQLPPWYCTWHRSQVLRRGR